MGSSVFCLSIRSIALIPFILVEFYNQCKKDKEAKMEKKKIKKIKSNKLLPTFSNICKSNNNINLSNKKAEYLKLTCFIHFKLKSDYNLEEKISTMLEIQLA